MHELILTSQKNKQIYLMTRLTYHRRSIRFGVIASTCIISYNDRIVLLSIYQGTHLPRGGIRTLIATRARKRWHVQKMHGFGTWGRLHRGLVCFSSCTGPTQNSVLNCSTRHKGGGRIHLYTNGAADVQAVYIWRCRTTHVCLVFL